MDVWNDAEAAAAKVRARLRPGPIAWKEILSHALIGVGGTVVTEVFRHGWGALTALVLLVAFTVRVVVLAKRRHRITLQEAAELVWHGEVGSSRWNLRLQAAAPALAGLAVLVIVALLR